MKNVFYFFLICIFLVLLSNCSKPQFIIQPEEISSLYSSKANKKAKNDNLQIIFKDENVSIRSRNVVLSRIVNLISEKYQLPLIYTGELRGNISVNLKDIHHLEILKIILKMNHYALKFENNLFTIVYEQQSGIISREIKLKYLDAKSLSKSLKTTYAKRKISITLVPEHNALILSGESKLIHQMDIVINNLDIPSPSILLEIILVEVNKTRLEEFGLSLSDLTNKKINIEKYNPNNTLNDTLTNFELLGNNSDRITNGLIFKMNIKALNRIGLAKIITHPHVVCRSGEKAKVEVGLDNYVYIQKGNSYNSQPYYDIKKIKSGVVLEVLPTITNSGLILINFSAHESNIVSPHPNSAFSIDQNSLNSSLLAKDGEVLIAGGLLQKSISDENQGIPFFYKIPIVNLFFKKRTMQEDIKEVVFYIIPKKFNHDYNPYFNRPVKDKKETPINNKVNKNSLR